MSAPIRSFGPYQLVRRLGMGGMAETFEAVRLGPGGFEQRVCVKRILPSFEQDPQFVQLFLEEARLAARLRHANIVQVIDFGVAEGSHYLALELVLGCDLRDLMRAERARAASAPDGPPAGLTSGLVVFLAQELAVALEVAHSGDEVIVHRDISPANVLLSTAGEVKLSDFGIARAIGNQQATATSTIKGKVPYMAPEYALRGHVDRRVDLFALGVLLYECLAGVRPFDGRSELETLNNLERGVHIPLRERCPGAPSALVDAIEQLILPAPDARIQSASALLDALVDVAPPPTARRILGELVTRWRAARPGGEAHGTAVDALAHPATEPAASSAGPTAAQRRRPAKPTAATVVLPNAHHDARRGPARPFAAAASSEVTRTATPASAIADADTRAASTRTSVDPAGDASGRTTDAEPPTAAPGASPEPTSGGTFDPRELEPTAPLAGRRHAPLGLIALGAVALLGSAALTLFLIVSWHQTPPTVGAHALTAPPMTTAIAAPGPRTPAPTIAAVPLAPAPTIAAVPLAPASTIAALPAAQAVAPAPTALPTKRHSGRAPASVAEDEEDLSSRALLSVISDRGGDIYVDGRRAGSSSVSLSLLPGRHVLANGASDDATSLIVDLGRGERRRVVLR